MRTHRAISASPPVEPAFMKNGLWNTLPGRLLAHCKSHPNRVALREKRLGIWQQISWAEYYQQVAAVGRMLSVLGVEPGDHVSILSDNRPEWLYADLGAQGIGARSVGVYQTNPPADVQYVLAHSQTKVLFCEDQEQVDKAIEIRTETSTIIAVVVFDPRGTRDYDDPRLMTWSDFLTQGKALMAQEPMWFEEKVQALDRDETAMIVYTSGTTGNPKGAMLSSRNALAIPDSLVKVVGGSRHDQILSYLPLCHVAEKIFSIFLPLSVGCIVHFGESIETVREDLKEVSPTIFLGVPRIWEKMHASTILKMQDSSWLKRMLFSFWTKLGRRIAMSRNQGAANRRDDLLWWIGDILVYRPLQERLGLRRCTLPVSGAAPISDELLRWFHGIGVPVIEGYGQTECAGVSHVNPPNKPLIGSVGQAMPDIRVELGIDGEILVRGASVFVGYLHNEEATQEALDSEGWLHTGDIGTVDERGFYFITGRKKEIIITAGGKNLSPEKIENALKTSPYIKEVVAIGDRRKFVSALIQIDRDATGDWAQRQEVSYTSFGDLASKDEVRALIAQEVNKANELLARVEQVRGFKLFQKELNQDDGELTATQKVRRRAIHDAYDELIESIYHSKGA